MRLDLGRCTMSSMDSSGLLKTTELLPLDVLAMWHVGGTGRTWAAPVIGLHLELLDDAWRAALMYGVQGGLDIIQRGAHRLGLGLRFETTTQSDLRYTALGLGLVYRR
jgi:hypothetical protein